MVSNVARKGMGVFPTRCCAVRLVHLLWNLVLDRPLLLSNFPADRLRLLAKLLVDRARSLSNLLIGGARLCDY